MISAPISGLDREVVKRLEAAYKDAMASCGPNERDYIRNRLPSLLQALRQNNSEWKLELAELADHLWSILSHANGEELPTATAASITATLFYLCNPYDIIPDYTPGTGFLDDAQVLLFCINDLRKNQPQLYQRLCDAHFDHNS